MATNSITNNTDLEIFTLIWLDATINQPENKQTQYDLRKLTNQFKAFDNSEECQPYIQSLPIDEHIVLIVSGQLGRKIVPDIHQIDKIYSIYVYCIDEKSNREWSKIYPKIKNVLTTKDELIEQIRRDNKKEIAPIDHDPLYINIYNNNPDDQFIHSQLLIDYLLKIKQNSTIDTQFFTLCKTEYAEDNLQLKNLEEFQKNSSSKNILWWLIKDKFLSKLLTKAFHTRNIDLLYSSRFYIHDINQQLQLNKCSSIIHVYHSHLITDQELEELKNSIGKLISINTFFLTTFQRDKALDSLKQTNNSQKILFEIDADPTVDNIKPFANITSLSYSTKQSQIIFMLGSIFRIKNIYQQNHIWICQMNLSSRTDPDLNTIFEQIIKEDGDSEADILSFGNVLARIGQYDHAEKYYQHILNELPSNHEDTYICYRNLGNVAYVKKDYDKSLEYHLKSLEIKKSILPTNDPNIGESYNCLGAVYFEKKDYKQAMDSFQKGLDIMKLSSNICHIKVAVILMNIGLVYRTEINYPKALDYYQQALEIVKKYLSEDHSDLGQIYHNIGAIYWCRGYYDKAMEYYNLSLKNKEKYLPETHPSIAMTLENMGLIYENKNDFQEALKYYEKASKIYEQTLLLTHKDVIQIKDNILRVSSHLK